MPDLRDHTQRPFRVVGIGASAVEATEQMDISDEDRHKIFADNTRKVFRLHI